MRIHVIHDFSTRSYRTLSRSMYDIGYLLGRIFRLGCLAFAGYIGGSFIRALFFAIFR